MVHDDDTLNLVENYRKRKYHEKENRQFTKSKKLPKLSLIPIILFIVYFLIINLSMNKYEILKPNQQKKEKTNTVISEPISKETIIEVPQKIVTKNIEIIPNKPISKKHEPIEQTATIKIISEKTTQKQETIKKVEVKEEEEIRPGSSTSNIEYYR